MYQLDFRAVPIRLALLASAFILTFSACAATDGPSLSAEGEGSPALRSTKLLPPAGSDYVRFGHAVATDGQTVVVGAWGHEAEAGAVYVYEATGEGWAQTALLMADDASSGARFGYSVDVDGSRIAVGAIYDAGAGHDTGAVYLFEKEGEAWKQSDKLIPEGEAEHSHLGRAVALEGDLLAAGAPGPGASAVYTFSHASGGWKLDSVLSAPGGAEVRFGTSVTLANKALAVGAWTESPLAAGYVAVYERTANGWTEPTTVTSSEPGDRFGYSVSLDGEFLIVGAPDATVEPPLRLFQRGFTGWTQMPALAADQHSPELGHVVALQQGRILAGDPAFDGSADHGGQVLLVAPGSATAPAVLLPQDLKEGSSFGISVAAGGDLIVVGAVGDKTSGQAAGAAYIYY